MKRTGIFIFVIISSVLCGCALPSPIPQSGVEAYAADFYKADYAYRRTTEALGGDGTIQVVEMEGEITQSPYTEHVKVTASDAKTAWTEAYYKGNKNMAEAQIYTGDEWVKQLIRIPEPYGYGEKISLVAATTIFEVERRTRSLVSELQKRHIHADVVKCCKEEYLQENYFHAVFEAAKSLSEKVREKTSLQEDGSALFNTAFSVNNPRLALNALQTSTEKNIQNGLKEMLNGVTHMIRNVTAHELKVKWVVNEQDAIDILTTISFLHKQLDECFVVSQHII